MSPLPAEYCQSHGSYTRTVRTGGDCLALTILRVRCPPCRKTHALLPSFLAPYGRYPVAAHEAAVTEQAAGVPVEEAGAVFGQAVETSKRWLAFFRSRIALALGALRGALGQLGQYRWAEESSPLPELTRLCDTLCTALSLPVPVKPGRALCRGESAALP